MALKLEDLINKKKEPNQILDLSKIKIKSREEFEKYFDKIPEFKIRPEKVRAEEVRVRDTDFSFKRGRREGKKKEFSYCDPCPPSMRSVRLEDLASVDISWRMLTMLRPKNRLEEDIFSRLVELGKFRLATRNLEAKQLEAVASGAPGSQSNALMLSMGVVVTKSKKGAVETKIKICKECGLELCNGAFCKEFPYDAYTRMMLDKDELETEEQGNPGRRASKGKGVKGSSNNKGPTDKGLNLKKKRKKKKKSIKKKKKKEDSDSSSDD